MEEDALFFADSGPVEVAVGDTVGGEGDVSATFGVVDEGGDRGGEGLGGIRHPHAVTVE